MCSTLHPPEMIAEVIDQNIDRIKGDLLKSGLTYDKLQDDVLDHVCCMLEEELESGEDFESSYDKILDFIGNKTLGNLQHQTLILLDKKFQRMKNFTYVFGLTTAIIAIIGALFKKMHWPGASILLTVGIGLVLLVFLPLYFIINYREQTEKKNPVYGIVGYLTLAMLLCAALFKIQHWPGANVLIDTSIVLLVIGFIPLYVVNVFQKVGKQKISLPYIVMVLIGSAVLLVFINVNMSKDLLDIYQNETVVYEQRIETIQDRSDKLIAMTNDTVFANVEELIMKIHSEATALQMMIKDMQNEMLVYVKQEGITVSNLDHIDNKGAGREVIVGSGKGGNFARATVEYRLMLDELIKDPIAAVQISDHLEFTGNVWKYEYGVRDVQQDPLMKNYFKLTDASLGIALSEYIAIANLMHNDME